MNIRNVIKELKNKKIEEILNNKKYNFKIIEQEKKELRKEYEEENKRKKDGEKKRIEDDEK